MKRVFSIVVIALVLLTVGLAIYERDVIACSFVEYSSFEQIDSNVYVASATSEVDRERLLLLLGMAKRRVTSVYGNMDSTPVIIAAMSMDSLSWFASNEYASTKFLPGESYIVIGPKGHNIDVISHELVHSGIFEQVGYWDRSLHIPVWFDEGAAMQVDSRKKYDVIAGKGSSTSLDSLRYSWQFNRGNDIELTNHYAISKMEIEIWLSKAGEGSVQSLLKQVRSGEDFDESYRKMRDSEG